MAKQAIVQIALDEDNAHTKTRKVLLTTKDERNDTQNCHDLCLDTDGGIIRQNSKLRASYSRKVYMLLSFEENIGLMKQAFMPLYWSLRIAGLVYMKDKNQKCSLSMVHSIVVLLIVWANVFRQCFTYDKEDGYTSLMMLKILAHIWCTEVAIGATFFLVKFRVNIPKLLKDWDDYRQTFFGITTLIFKKKILTVIISFWISFIIWAIVIIIVYCTSNTFLNIVTKLMLSDIFHHQDKNVPIWAQGIYQIVLIHIILLYMLPVVYLCLMCYLLSEEYSHITTKLQAHLTCGDSLSCIEDIRKQHMTLTNIVITMDDIVSLFLLTVYVLDIPTICFNIFVIMFDDHTIYGKDHMSILAQTVCFLMCTFHVIIVTVAGSTLTCAVSIYLIRLMWYCVCIINSYSTLLNWPIVSLRILFYFIIFSNVFFVFYYMTILFALLVILAISLVTTITSLYDLTI